MSDFNTLAVNHYTTVIHHKEGKPRVLLSDLNSSQSTEASTKFAQLTSSPESLSLKIREQVSSEKRQNESYFNNFMAPSICCFQQEWRLLWQFVCVCMFFFFFLWMHKNFRIICFSSVKNILGILIGIALNLQIALSSMGNLIILVLPIQGHRICSFLHQYFMVFRVQVFHSLG